MIWPHFNIYEKNSFWIKKCLHLISVLKRTESVQLWLKICPTPRSGPSRHSLAATKELQQNMDKFLTSALRKSREVHFPPSCASEYLNRVVPTPSVKSLAALVPHRGAWNMEPLVETILCSNQAKVSSSEPQGIVNCIGQCYLFLQIRAGTIPTDVLKRLKIMFVVTTFCKEYIWQSCLEPGL